MKVINIIVCTLMCCNSVFASTQYDKLAHRLMFDYAKSLKARRGFALSGFGGAMMDDIKKISLDFISFDCVNVEGARRLYVEVVEGLVDKVNSDEKIRPYLHNYPFTAENVEVMIGFEDKKRQIRSDGSVALMFIGRNKEICYRGYNSEKSEYYHLYRESYEEALKNVKTKNCTTKESSGCEVIFPSLDNRGINR